MDVLTAPAPPSLFGPSPAVGAPARVSDLLRADEAPAGVQEIGNLR